MNSTVNEWNNLDPYPAPIKHLNNENRKLPWWQLLLSTVAPDVIFMTGYGATTDNKVRIMESFCLQLSFVNLSLFQNVYFNNWEGK